MIGIQHTVVIGFGMLGLLLGGVLIDLDHNATWKCKWDKFWSYDTNCPAPHGKLHQPIVMYSTMAFAFGIAIGLLIHIIMDGCR